MSIPHPADEAFVRAVLGDPEELTTWLAYADWLDEQDDPRADFIRLEIRRGELPASDPTRVALRARLEILRGVLDRDWTAVFDRPPVENCAAPGGRCPGRWERLRGTDRADVRDCGECERRVYFCHDIESARTRAWSGERVAVRSGLRRTPYDLMDAAEAEAWASLFTDPRLRFRDDRPD